MPSRLLAFLATFNIINMNMNKPDAPQRSLVRLSNVERDKIKWFWKDRIPEGSVTLVDGDPGHGKSTIAYDLVARVTTGRSMPCDDSATAVDGGAVILQGEDSCSIVRERVAAAGGNVDRVAVYDRRLFAEMPLILPRDMAIVEAAVAEVSARLLVIDPVTCFLGDQVGNEQRIRAACDQLGALAERRDLAVVMCRHLTKSSGSNPLYRGIGSIGLIAAVRSALAVAHDPQSTDKFQHVLVQTKGSLASAPALRYRTQQQGDARTIEWLGATECSPEEALGQVALDRSALTEAAYVLFSLLQDGALPADEVRRLAKRSGVADRTLLRAKRLLDVRSVKHGSGRGSHWTWALCPTNALVNSWKDREIDELAEKLFYGDQGTDDRIDLPEVEEPKARRHTDDGDGACHDAT